MRCAPLLHTYKASTERYGGTDVAHNKLRSLIIAQCVNNIKRETYL